MITKDKITIWSRRPKTYASRRSFMRSLKRWSQSWSNSSISKNWTMNARISLWRLLVWITVLKEATRRANIRWLWRIKITRKTRSKRSRKTVNIGITKKSLTWDNNSKGSPKSRWKERPIRNVFNSIKRGPSMKNKRETWKSFKKTASLISTTK